MKIPRFLIYDGAGNYPRETQESPDGIWCWYADVENLERELCALESKIVSAHERAMHAEADEYVIARAFAHRHEGPGDKCRKCGVDLRHEVHSEKMFEERRRWTEEKLAREVEES